MKEELKHSLFERRVGARIEGAIVQGQQIRRPELRFVEDSTKAFFFSCFQIPDQSMDLVELEEDVFLKVIAREGTTCAPY